MVHDMLIILLLLLLFSQVCCPYRHHIKTVTTPGVSAFESALWSSIRLVVISSSHEMADKWKPANQSEISTSNISSIRIKSNPPNYQLE